MNVEHLLIHSVHVATVATSTSKGVATYSAPVEYPARVWQQRSVVETSQGESVETTHVAQLLVELHPNDRVWIAGTTPGNAAQALTPVSITAFTSLYGDVTLYEVALG